MWTLPREGYSSATQCILYYTFICAAKIEEHMDNFAHAEKFIETSKRTKENIINEFWDDERGILIDNLKLINTRIPVMTDVNCYAINFEIVGKEKADRILEYLKKNMWTDYGSATLDYRMERAQLDPTAKAYPLAQFINAKPDPEKAIIEFMYPHNRMIWPFVVAYEVEARFLADKVESAFDLIERCWGNMLNEQPGTFWECVDADTGNFPMIQFFPGSNHDCYNSAAHGWSGWISYILQAHVLGVKAIEPGYKKTLIKPQTGKLNSISGEMPTPYGAIKVKISKDDINYNIEVICPEKIECIVEISDDELNSRKINLIETKF